MPRPDLNGLKLRDSRNGNLYLIDQGKKRHIHDTQAYFQLFEDYEGILGNCDELIDEIDIGEDIIYTPAPGGLVFWKDDPKVYYFDGKTRRWIIVFNATFLT